jgi:hypothetical protein
MTATVTGLPGSDPGSARRPDRRGLGRRGWGRGTLSTPSALRAVLAGLVVLSLAWGAFGGWAAIQHSSAADAVVSTDERASQDAAAMYKAIADADVTITASYLKNPEKPQLNPLQRYDADIKTATTSLDSLQAAGGDAAMTAALAAIGPGLNIYTGDIAEAKTEYAMGYPLTGGSFLQVASVEAHVVLLPAANTVFQQENAALSAASGQATEMPTLIGAVVLAVLAAFVLFRVQRWLTQRTNRMFNVGLVLASVLLAVSALWLAIGFLSARSDLNRGLGHGSAPAQALALASIDVQQIRGDAVLNVISRSGNASFHDDFASTSQLVGPAQGGTTGSNATGSNAAGSNAGGATLLDSAAAAQLSGSSGASYLAAAKRDATAWYAANAEVYRLGKASNYRSEKASVVGTSAAGYTRLEQNIGAASDADQKVFTSAATSGAHTLDPLGGVVIAAGILMALACAWALTRRLEEYR